MAKIKKKETDEKKVKLVEVWPLHKLERLPAPKGAYKIDFEVVWLGIPENKMSDGWAQNLIWEDTLIEANEELVKYIISIAEPGEAHGLVQIAGTSVARKLARREEAVYGKFKPAGTSEDGTHVWSTSFVSMDKSIIALGGKWSAGISKFHVKGTSIYAEVWFLKGKDFYARIQETDIARVYKPSIESEEGTNT